MQPAAAVAIRAMPVLGAAVGSETVQQIAQDAPRKERERWLEDRVLEQFDEVYTHVKGSIERMRRNFEPAFVSITAPGPQDVWWGEAVPEIPK